MRNLLLLLLFTFSLSLVYGQRPNAPTNFKAVQAAGEEAINLSWKAPTNITPNIYFYYIKEKGTSKVDSFRIAPATSITITKDNYNLQFGKTYDVWLKAVNENRSTGRRYFSDPTATKSVEIKGLVAPSITTENSSTPWNSIVLKINDPNSIESGFEISINEVGGGESIINLNKTGSKITETLSDLSADTWYIIRVRAVRNETKGPWSNSVEHKTEVDMPPSATLSQISNCPNNVIISWDVAERFDDVVSMKLLKSSDNNNFKEVSDTKTSSGTYEDTETKAGNTYYYILQTSNSSGNTNSNTLKVEIPAYQAPHPPYNPNLVDRQLYSLSFSWELNYSEEDCGINTMSHVEVEYNLDGGNPSGIIQLDKSTTFYTVDNLGLKNDVELKIRTVSDQGLASNWVSVTGQTWGLPYMPSNLQANPIRNKLGESVIEISWNDNSDDEEFFEILRSTDGVNFTQFTVLAPNYTRLTDTQIKEGQKYYYKIGAQNWVGLQLDLWEYTGSIGPVTPDYTKPPTAPYGLNLKLIGNGIDITWVDDTNRESGYVIERSSDGIDYTLIADLGQDITYYRDENIEEYRTYFYRVKAVNPIGSSPYSEIEYLTVMDPNGQANFDINVYPNPTVESISIKGKNTSDFKTYQLRVFDQNNRVILEREIDLKNGNIFNFDLSNLKSGVYNFIINDNQNLVTKKIIKL